MILLARLFPTARGSRPAAAPSRRRGPKARHRRGRSLARLPSLATESLERRALLAVSATLAGGDLLITYNEPGDLMAEISSDGTKYTVSGTGLAAEQFNVADVTGRIIVEDAAALGGQEFKVLTGTAALANPLEVNANVEATLLSGGITATKAGVVLIGSSAITLANDISTVATNANIVFTGAVTLAKNTAANSTGATTFGGAVGGTKALVSLATNAGGTASLLSVTTTGTQTYNDDTVTLTARTPPPTPTSPSTRP